MNNKTEPRRDPAQLITDQARLRDLNERLMAIGEQLRNKAPDSFEAVIKQLEKEVGPEVLKDIYDQIPNGAASQDSSDQHIARTRAPKSARR